MKGTWRGARHKRTVPDPLIASAIRDLLREDPDLCLRKAHRKMESPGTARIDRNGVVYRAKRSHVILNPERTEGRGLSFVWGDDRDPVGIFFTEGIYADDRDYLSALKAYLLKCGVPRSSLTMTSAAGLPGAHEETAETIRALEEAGALALREVPGNDDRE